MSLHAPTDGQNGIIGSNDCSLAAYITVDHLNRYLSCTISTLEFEIRLCASQSSLM